MENERFTTMCKQFCSRFEYRNETWCSCNECIKRSKFHYEEGSDPFLDMVFKSGYQDGKREGVHEGIPRHMVD